MPWVPALLGNRNRCANFEQRRLVGHCLGSFNRSINGIQVGIAILNNLDVPTVSFKRLPTSSVNARSVEPSIEM